MTGNRNQLEAPRPRQAAWAARRPLRTQRRGAAMIVVMAMLTMTLVVSYAVLRSSSTVVRIQTNAGRDTRARQAAAAGIAAALRTMHNSSDWNGVGSTVTGSISTNDTYSVSYTTGDAALTAANPDYYQWPYRVTLLSTGTAFDPDNPSLNTTHQIEVVVQLVRQAVGTQPANWSLVNDNTIVQSPGTATIEFPCRLQGPVRLYGDLSIFLDYPNGNSRAQFGNDLRLMNLAGQGDFRPFNGSLSIRSSGQSGDDVTFTSNTLGHALTSFSGGTVNVVPTPTLPATYQLYTGGASYTAPAIVGALANTTLEPDPMTNPLGIFRRTTTLNVGSNVTLRGTLLSSAKVSINGTNVQLQSFDLPALYEQYTPMRLPVIHVDDFAVTGTANCTISGLVAAYDDFQFAKGSADASLAITGKVACGDLLIEGRTEWDQLAALWDIWLFLFNSQKSSGEPYYTNYMSQALSQALTSRCTIVPSSTTYTYLGQGFSGPLYVPAAGANGLRWDVVRWTDLE